MDEEETETKAEEAVVRREALNDAAHDEAVEAEVATEEESKRMPLKESLVERARKIREVFVKHMDEMQEPTTVAEIAKAIGANRVTIAKYIAQSMQNGNPYNLGIKRVGMYEIIWKKLSDYEEKIAEEANESEVE